MKKIANGNYIIINNLLTGKLNNHDNNDNDKEANLKNKKELKEQSTNTYINDVDINNYESDTLRLNSIDSNINKSSNYTNIPKKKIIKPKTSLNKKNKSINSVENTKTINNNSNNKKDKIITRKINHINNISINNNIKLFNYIFFIII